MDECSITHYVKVFYAYDPSTGMLQRKKGGKPISVKPSANGYLRVSVGNKRFYQHRVAWLLYYGAWPKGQVDHINGDRTDNRIDNLRDVSHTMNAQNVHHSSGATGVVGVSFDKARGKFKAQISVGPRGKAKGYCLGRFDTIEEAEAAYIKAKKKHHTGYSPQG